MSKFKMKIQMDEETLVKAKGERIEDFDNIFKELKYKFNGRKG